MEKINQKKNFSGKKFRFKKKDIFTQENILKIMDSVNN